MDFKYQCRVVEVLNASLLKVEIDLGFRVCKVEQVRLDRIHDEKIKPIPETETEFDLGKSKVEFVSKWVKSADESQWPFFIITRQSDGYGEYVCDISRKSDGECLNDRIIQEFGVEYNE
jgi:hypothetical protein